MTVLPSVGRCGICGAEISADGLCPACMLDCGLMEAEPRAPGSFAIRSFGDYELFAEIARGGMGVVYKARQKSLDRIVAVKMVLAGRLAKESDLQRFKTEAETAARLQHSNIVAIHEVGEVEGQPFFSMDYVEGQSLAELARNEPLPAARAADYLKTIAEAVSYAHSKGVLHRDLKPSNILIDQNDQPRITDFGLAKRIDESQCSAPDPQLTVTGQVLGSPNFMPPEQATGDRKSVGPASDVYSLGAILYQLLTGRPPFAAETLSQTLRLVAETEPVLPRLLNPSAPRDLETICLKCLEKELDRRYSTAQALADDLNRFLRNDPIRARPAGLVLKAHRWCLRNKALAAAGTVILTLLLAGAIGSTIAALRITRERQRAEQYAQSEAGQRAHAEEMRGAAESALYQSRLNENRALSLARLQGWSDLAFRNLSNNVALPNRDILELRKEAAACLETIDVREAGTLEGHSLGVWSLDFSPDSSFLASADYNGVVRIWDLSSRKVFREIKDSKAGSVERYNPAAPLPVVRFNPSGGEVAYSTWRHSIEILGLTKQDNPVQQLSYSAHARQLGYDRSGGIIGVAWADGHAVAYEAGTGKVIKKFSSNGGIFAVSPEGTAVATMGAEDAIQLHSLRGAYPPVLVGRHQGVQRLSFSPRGDRLASTSDDHTAKIFDPKAAREVITLAGHKARVHTAEFSKDGRLVATVSDDETARLWDVYTGEMILLIRPSTGYPLLAAAFSPDGRHLALAAGDTIVLYDIVNEAARQRLFGHRYYVRSLAFHPTRPLLVSASGDNSLRLWNVDSGGTEAQLPGHPRGRPHGLAFSPDGELLAVGHGSYDNYGPRNHGIRLLEAITGKLRGTFSGHERDAQCVAINSTGKLLASGDLQGTVIVHSIANGREERRWGLAADGVVGLQFCSRADWLVMAHASGQIRLGDCRSGEILAQIKTTGTPKGFALAPKTDRLAVAPDCDAIQVFAIPSLSLIATNQEEVRGACSLAFDSRGLMLASGGLDRRATLWNPDTGAKLLELAPSESAIYCLAFDANGDRLAIASAEEQITVWNLKLVRNRLRELGIDWVEDAGGGSPRTAADRGPLPESARANLAASPTLELPPPDADFLISSADFFARRGRWKEAAAEAAQAVALQPSNHMHYHTLAPLLAASGDIEAYRRHCQRAMGQFRGTRSAGTAERMAKDCLILPASGVDLEAVSEWAETAVTAGAKSEYLPYYHFTKGLAEYRKGNFTNVVPWMIKSLVGTSPMESYRHVEASAVLAMAHHRLNEETEARNALAKCFELAQGKLPRLGGGDLGDGWRDWIIAKILMREASALIEGHEAQSTAVLEENP